MFLDLFQTLKIGNQSKTYSHLWFPVGVPCGNKLGNCLLATYADITYDIWGRTIFQMSICSQSLHTSCWRRSRAFSKQCSKWQSDTLNAKKFMTHYYHGLPGVTGKTMRTGSVETKADILCFIFKHRQKYMRSAMKISTGFCGTDPTNLAKFIFVHRCSVQVFCNCRSGNENWTANYLYTMKLPCIPSSWS